MPLNTLSPTQAQEIMTALQSEAVPPLSWFEERLPGITQELVEHLLDTAVKIKDIIDNP